MPQRCNRKSKGFVGGCWEFWQVASERCHARPPLTRAHTHTHPNTPPPPPTPPPLLDELQFCQAVIKNSRLTFSNLHLPKTLQSLFFSVGDETHEAQTRHHCSFFPLYISPRLNSPHAEHEGKGGRRSCGRDLQRDVYTRMKHLIKLIKSKCSDS